MNRLLAAFLPRTRVSVLSALRADRFLLVSALVLFVAACAPLCVTPFLPFSDLGVNTAVSEMLAETALGHEPAATYHRLNWTPVPYWTSYLLTALTGRILGPLLAAKFLTAVVIALLPLSTMRLLLSLGRDPRLGLWAFALVWQQNLYAGWLAFMLAVSLVSFALSWIIEAETIADGLRIAPYTAAIALTHVQGTWLLGVCGGLLCLTTGTVWRRAAIHLVAGSGAALMTLLWLWRQLGSGSGGSALFSFGWHSPAYKLSKVFVYTLDNFSRPDHERVAAVAFVILLLGPVALTQLPQRPFFDRRSPLVLVLGAGVLYALLWWEVGGPITHWYTYPRYASVAMLWWLLFPAPRRAFTSALALLPGICAALALDYVVLQQFRGFAERTKPLLEVIREIPERASVLAFVLDDNDPDPDLRLPPYHQLYGYVTAMKHGYTPYLWSNSSLPLLNREVSLPAPGWGGAFSMQAHGRHYDYLLVQGFAHGDPVRGAAPSDGYGTRLVLERARWRLYAVTKPPGSSR